VQDVLPIPPFIDDEELPKAEWKMECFMREVLVPLAAQTAAMIVGSAFKDASLMMMFARVSKSLASKYGGMGSSPWTMLGFAGAPKLLKSLDDPNSVVTGWFKLSARWREKRDLIAAAKLQSGKGEVNEEEDYDIPYDVNPDLGNLIIIDCVRESADNPPVIDMAGKTHIEAAIMDYLVSSLAVIGVGTMHAVNGYAGLAKAVNYLNMKVPLLLLDLRDRDEHGDITDNEGGALDEPLDRSQEGDDQTGEAVVKRALRPSSAKSRKSVQSHMTSQAGWDDIQERLAAAIRTDNTLSAELKKLGRADIYEVCRVAYFHERFLQNASSGAEQNAELAKPKTIWEAIEKTRKEMSQSGNAEEQMRKQQLIETGIPYFLDLLRAIAVYCVQLTSLPHRSHCPAPLRSDGALRSERV
jgi:hypothetical protein